ncbi:MAG TPA: D-alanyl-D-alanine carboxypeptidase/D-alanyl-D-alanine-endopeptidase [Longimicrobiaceae bacterium]|nr:D-alanyl-D-alanine carboxypeptidase/D-alanyl-D-alanine-endopeptidase [Longimicrobiaceae bacterium]
MRPNLLTAAALALLTSGCSIARPATGPRPASLAMALDSAFDAPQLSGSEWGVLVKSLRTGEVLYERNAGKLFTPASNMKLLTASATLEALGPDYRYRTTFAAEGPVSDGVLHGDLVVRGTGDPTFSGRFFPDARTAMRQWADSLRAHGITRIAGGIIGVDSAFSGPTLGAGWSWDDLAAYYSTEFDALQFNEGAILVRVTPSRTLGEPGIVVLDPPTGYVRVNNATVTTAPGTPARLEITRDPAGPGITLRGQIPADTPYVAEDVAVRGPVAFFLQVLRETLRQEGVAVEGQALPVDDWLGPRLNARDVPIFTYSSPPMSEIVPGFLKPSQNWIAETLLHTLGYELRGEGSARAGAAVEDSIFSAWGLPTDKMRIADGSGLSRFDLVTPELLVGILTHMRQSPDSTLWYNSLPVGGVDGTLRRRMPGPPLRGNVHAKTGTLTSVRSLSGYLTTVSGEPIVFSILNNHHLHSASAVDEVVDAALRMIAERY